MKTNFDKRAEYTELISEKVMELKKLCHMQRMPMFITVCVANDASGTLYEKEMVSAATCGVDLADNQIAKHVNVSLGFDTIQPSSDTELEMEDVSVDYIEEEGENKDD